MELPSSSQSEQQQQQQQQQPYGCYPYQEYFRVRTITCFVQLHANHFDSSTTNTSSTLPHGVGLKTVISAAAAFLRRAEQRLTQAEYTVQTLRIATNPFGEWLGGYGGCHDDDMDTTAQQQLHQLDQLLHDEGIHFCALGPATTVDQVQTYCAMIASWPSQRFSCSALLEQNDVYMATACAATIRHLSTLPTTTATTNMESDTDTDTGSSINSNNIGLSNFRFTVAAAMVNYIPFFPIASAAAASTAASANAANENKMHFAIGLENGALLRVLLEKCDWSMANIATIFRDEMCRALEPLQHLCCDLQTTTNSASTGTTTTAACTSGSSGNNGGSSSSSCVNSTTTTVTTPFSYTFVGIDTSLNPALDRPDGSVAAAIEGLHEVSSHFGSAGTLAAAAALTTTLQSLPGIRHCGYAGLMLPVCEDARLAELTTSNPAAAAAGMDNDGDATVAATSAAAATAPLLRISNLLSISQVCGVGLDTVPIPGDCTEADIASLLLDVAGIAHRWNKCLSCRLFPVVGKAAGERTTFDSPYMINACILPLS